MQGDAARSQNTIPRLRIDRRIGGFPRYILTCDNVDFPMIPSELLKSVVFLCPPRHGLPVEDEPKGTGFFIRYLQQGMVFVYIVTARHCIDGARMIAKERGLDDTIYLRLNKRDGTVAHIKTSGSDWKFHPGPQPVDIAILPFDQSELSGFDVDFFPLGVLGGQNIGKDESPPTLGIPDAINHQQVGPGDEVAIAGLFRSHFGQNRNIPIIRMGNIAAMPSEPVLVEWPDRTILTPMEAYLVDTRSIKGLSGSPVYVNLPDQKRSWNVTGPAGEKQYLVGRFTTWYLLGVVHGHFNVTVPDTDWETQADAESLPKANAGMCIVVPITKVLETLGQTSLTDQRRTAIEHRPINGTTETDYWLKVNVLPF
jgi:hypothetical protein